MFLTQKFKSHVDAWALAIMASRVLSTGGGRGKLLPLTAQLLPLPPKSLTVIVHIMQELSF